MSLLGNKSQQVKIFLVDVFKIAIRKVLFFLAAFVMISSNVLL